MAKKEPKKSKKKKGDAAPDASLPSIAAHPRAGEQVKRAKAWGGLIGFVLVALLSWRAHVPTADLLLRALIGGIVVYLVTWAGAVLVWRHLVLAELRAARAAVAERAAAARDAQVSG